VVILDSGRFRETGERPPLSSVQQGFWFLEGQLSTDRPRSAVQTYRGGARRAALPADAVRSLGRREGTTPCMVLLAAWAVLLGRHAEEDVLVASPASGGTALALRLGMEGKTFRELLASVRSTALDAGPERLDLDLVVWEGEDSFEGCLEYNADLFDGSTAERLLARFAVLLEAGAGDPGMPVAELPLLLPAERQQMLVEWNDTPGASPHAVSFPELFGAAARAFPEEPAVISAQGEAWSYRRLDEASDRLARRLRALGVGMDQAVGICMERSPELVLGVAAVLKAGGVYLPLNPAHPDERLEFQLADTGAALVLVHARTRERLEGRRRLEVDAGSLEAENGGSLGPVPAESLAYIIYTSGSTGIPKGVGVPHGAAMLHSATIVEDDALRPGERVVQFSSPSFDVSIEQMLPTLISGAAVVLRGEDLASPEEMLPAFARLGVTSANLPTAYWHQAVQGWSEDMGPLPLRLRVQCVGGEAMLPEAARRWMALAGPLGLGGVRLINGYGPTETVVTATRYTVPDSIPPGASSVPIGRPLPFRAAYVIDGRRDLQPLGVLGELCLGGVMARGYVNRPALTAERFVPNPFSGEPGARMYRTGDLVRQLPGGEIDYFGRIDRQVKIRGFRIEPGEIEAVLASHAAVAECAVVVREDRPGSRRLVGYVVLDQTDLTTAALAAWLRERLPDYMIPAAFVVLDALPLTANGKLDRKALPAPERSADAEGSDAPSDPVEELIAGIWAQVLELDRVGRRDDFFALGGHSLLATQVISRLRDLLGVEVPFRTLFEHPTVAALARVIQEERRPSTLSPPAPGRFPPLSFAQQRLWLLDQLAPDNPVYNIPLIDRLRGEVSVGLLARVFAEVVRRHEALRTTFAARDGQPVQVIAPAGAPPLPVVDLSDLPDAVREAWALRIAREEAWRPFDLEKGPLLRLGLVRLGERDHLLLITMSHIISDGWSVGVLLREVELLYEAFSQGWPSPLPELPVQYADFAVWQRSWFQGEVLERQLAYWKSQLDGAPQVLELPTDRPRPAVQTYRGGARRVALTGTRAEAVRVLCRREGVTPFMVLLAAWAVLLGRHAGQEDVLVGSPIAGRTRREIEDLIGFFVNTLALRIRMEGSDREGNGINSFRELLASVRSTALDACTHQDLPFERLVEELVTERDLSRAALVQVLFVLQDTPGTDLALPGIASTPVPLDAGLVKLELDLALWERADGFEGVLGHNADLFDASTAERLLDRFGVLLEAAARDPGRPVAELPLLLPEERRRLISAWSSTGREYPRDLGLHQLFEAAADRAPEAVAVIDGTLEVTYAELERRANQIAWHLRRLGVAPETLVGICAPRNADMIAGLLGTLKAGAAYLSLDPAYPRERLAFLLEDARAPVMLTREPLLDRIEGSGAPVSVCFDRDAALLDAESPERLPSAAGPGSLAYVIYTSGSTGRPKGVAIEHRSAVVLCHWARETFPAEDLGGMLASTSINFDLSVFEIFVPLAWGGTVILAENVLALPHLPAAGRVRFVNTVPSAMAELVRTDGLPPSVRTVGLAGEPLKRALAERIYGLSHVEGVYNLYGPSEDTTYSTWARVERGAPGEPTIGRPIANTELYLLGPGGPAMEPVPVGAVGEVYLGGAGLARGYLGRPDLTAERFLPDPFSGRPGARLYRVGDLGRLLPEGDVQFLGRVDHQVKIRGFRIELGEIETVLSRHPEVAEAVVMAMARRAPAGEPNSEPNSEAVDLQLVAYVEPHPGATVAAASLRTYLRERLPAHFVPSVFVLLDPLPRTLNGKVDRKALPEPDWTAASREEEAAQPRSGMAAARGPLEEVITGVWERVLGVRGIEPHQSFFALGGHSLLATQVISRLRDLLGVEVAFRTLFEHPTVAALSRVVQEERRPSTLLPLASDRFHETGERPPLSFAQQRLWFLDQFAPGSPAYNIPLAERLRGELSAELLARVFTEVVRRHEALRTTFAARDGQPVQVIAPAEAPPLPVVDLSGLADQESEALRIAMEEAWRPFDLEAGPLLRLGLVRLGEHDHLLLITMHHIVSDGWSVGVLLREVGALYEAFSQGEPSPLPELPLQYAGFAVWQRSWFQGEILERQLSYWKHQLAGAPQVLELSTDRPRPAVQTYRGGSRRVALTAAQADAVRALCRREGVTPFMLLLAAWALLLGRHAGQEDVLVGSPIAGRTRREIEDLIGFFVNTLVLRIRMEGGSFRTLLASVRSTALDAYSHQDLPFERLVEELVPERDLSRAALIQVLFVFQNTPGTDLALPGVASAPVALDADLAKLDLDLSLWEGADGFEGVLGHNADLFDASTAERLLARFAVLLDAAAGHPGMPVAELPILLPAERQQMLVEWSDIPVSAPREASFPELFGAAARAFPEEPAVISAEGEAWSYRRLDEASDRLARRLRALGVGLDQAVGLCMERSPELILGVVAVLKAGGVYLPLNPAHPDERLEFQLDDTGAALVLVHARTRERLEGRRRRRFQVDQVEPDSLAEESGGSLGPVPVEGLAYIIYTSGSTGIPKGVGVPHGAAMLHSATIAEDDVLCPGERVVQFSSPSFDVSIEQMLPALISGAAVVLRGEDLASPEEMLPAFARLGVTSANLPTAYWHQAVQGWSEDAGPLPLRLRVQCVGGEAMLPEAARRWMALAGPLGLHGVRLINGYGPTETVVTATRYTVPDSIPPGASSVPIGRTLPFRAAYVVDRRGDLQPLGVLGELCLGGVMARGYVNRPDLTAERFVPNPFSGEPGARMYRTGDLVRQLPGGEIDYFGRLDRQVKIRGFRIEPGEIEAVLASHPAVAECAVVVREDRPGSRRLVGYVVFDQTDPTDRTDPKSAALAAWLRERLPDYMIPAAFVVLDALPLTANGKLDRKALPAPERASDTERWEAPSDPVEELIARIWAQVLELDRVGLHDDFFALGGHSLLATQVASRLRTVLGAELPLRKLFEARTVADLARVVQEERRPSTLLPLAPGGFRATGENPPLSFAQQRLWFLDQLDPGSPAYNIPLAERLRGEISAELLARAFAEVVRRHEALRITFAATDGQPAQVIAPADAPPLPVVDLSDLPNAEREGRARQIAEEEAFRPFDLETGPLLRLGLVRLGERDHLLLITMHHIVSDGWSLGVLLHEVGVLYEAFSQGEPSPLPELPVQYADFAVWQRSWFQGEILERQLAYWKHELAGAPQVLELPTDRPRPAIQTYRGGSRRVALTAAQADAVRALCRREGMTPFMLLLAAWALLLGRHAGQEDVLVGSPIAGRTRRELEGLIGFFVNTLVLRIRTEGGSFRTLLTSVRSTALDAYSHQDLPFERLVEELVPERDLSRAAIIQVLFVFQNTPVTDLALPGVASAPVNLDADLAKFDLDLSLWEGADGFEGVLGHNADLFDASTAERLLARFAVLLNAAAGDPEMPLAGLPILLPAERQQMLVEWSAIPVSAPREASFPELFRAAASAFPEEPAVISTEGEAWSYRRLDEASDRLARRLRALGVGLDQAVGLCMERSPELILGVVAVLKAGGVYLPLNPAHPDERLEFQLDDTGAALVLVQARTRERLEGRRRLEVDAGSLEEENGGPLGPVPAESLAYIIYTSGSTGLPKGVGVPHGAAMVHSATIAEDDALRPGERVVQFSSLSFDVSIEQMLPTLISGAAVVLRGEDLASPEEMLPAFARLGVTSANLPTAYWHQAVQGWSADAAPLPLRLRVQCVGGEAMLPGAARRWMALAGPLGLGGVRLINGYGPTETVVTATRYTVPDSIPPGASSVPIGRTLPFRAAYVVDLRGGLQPLGVLGELCLGGVMARGYVNRPDLTAERFVPNPFSGEPGTRMYRTGDLVRQLPGGEIDYFGRIDRQVKIRGFRIEPGEIEAVLASHPAVAECAVVVREDRTGSRLLVGYVVFDRTDQTDPTHPKSAALAAWLRERLPDYMVPAAFVVLDALPLTAHGKLDRKALPAPERVADAEGSEAPSDPVEELIAGIWAQVLELDRVGLHDDFFALGGHSLLATQVASRIRTVLGAELPLRKLFEVRTVEELARAVRAARQEGTAQAPPVARRPADVLPPLSFGQQRFWFLERLDPGTLMFNIPALYAVRGPLRAGILRWTLAEIARRHEALRTTISTLPDGQAFQLVHPAAEPNLPVVDLSALPADLREGEAKRAAESEYRRGFSPERGPLVRFLLLRSGEDDHQFLATFHHLITDGLSMALFERELLALYAAFSAGRPSPFPELPVQYPDYAVWQRGPQTGDHLADQVAYWRRRLAPPLAALRLPTDHPRREVPSTRGTYLEMRLSRELADAVRELARREGSTLYITLLAAFVALLHRATGQRDLVLGTPVSLRERSNVEDLIGMFVNTLVIRAEVEPGASGASFRALLAHVRERVLEAFDHRDVPFERLVEELQPERSPNDPPFFQLMFALLAVQEKQLRAGDLELRPVGLSADAAQFELTLYVVDTGQDLVSQVEYRTELFDRATIEGMLAAWQALLEAATAQPDIPLAELPIPVWAPETRHPDAPASAEPPKTSAVQVDAAREAQLSEMKSQLSDAQKDRLKERLQRLKKGS